MPACKAPGHHGAHGAGLIRRVLSIVSPWSQRLANPHDVAVLPGMCVCFGLSTHVAMMNTLGFSHITGKAILSHTVGGLAAGVFAHWAYTLIMLL